MRAVALCVMVALVTVGISAPVQAQNLWTYEDQLPMGLILFPNAGDCRYKDRCQELQGIAILDVDMSAAHGLAAPGSDLRFNLYDTGDYLGSQLSDWRVCQYNQYDQLLGCRDTAGFGVWGTVNPAARSMRVILDQGIERPFELVIWT